jgi:hypothetical protein
MGIFQNYPQQGGVHDMEGHFKQKVSIGIVKKCSVREVFTLICEMNNLMIRTTRRRHDDDSS